MATSFELPSYQEIVEKHGTLPPIPTLLALDPGGTTGAAIFRDGEFSTAGQMAGTIPRVAKFIRDLNPNVIVMEDFVLYAHKAMDQKWKKMDTPRLIGSVELLCWDNGITLYEVSARQGKSFVTPEKLQAWGLYHRNSNHARDACRHGLDFLMFGKLNGNELTVPGRWYYLASEE